MKGIFILLFISVFSAFTGFTHPSDEIKTECGGRARIVWCQDAGEGSDAGAEGNNLRLMGFDTDDARGERCILTNLSNYSKPLLAPDGNKIIFSNRPERKIYMVGFDGSGLKEIANGFALAVWRDSLTETAWVYAGAIVNNADSVIINIRRFRLDKPEVSEPVWSKTPLNIDNFQLSADGRHACGVFPWPACGIAVLPDREWRKFGDGCWPSLSPDNNLLLWIFDGAHRNLTLFRTNTGERWVVNINNAPGIDGFEIYHPRWSNASLFMVMTGPYKLGDGSNRIHGGGKDVEIYLGRFSKDFKKIERWIKVTHNEKADFFPDLWLATPSCPALPVESGLQERKKEKKKTSADAWPGSFDGLVFYWQNRSKANTFTDPVTQFSRVCRAEAKGRARYGRCFEMAPSGGAFIADGGAGELINACAASGQLGIEALITPMYGDLKNAAGPESHALPLAINSGKGRATASSPCRLNLDSVGNDNLLPVIGYAAESGEWNFMLGRQGRQFVFKLKAEKGGADYFLPVCDLAGEKPGHVIISCSTSSVACFLNGEQVLSKDAVHGGNWQSGRIVFGNELRKEYAVNAVNERTGWRGLIENVALYSRWIGPEEARKKYNASIENISERTQIPALSVKAKLISMPVVPAPESIAPYRRALAVGQYRIEEVVAGTCSNKEIMVAQWAILDAQPVNPDPRRNGKKFSMELELFSDHPELEGERLIMAGDRFDLPLYYDVGD